MITKVLISLGSIFEVLLQPQYIISIISVLIAFAGLSLNFYQIRLSNKHNLFDKRLDIYDLFLSTYASFGEIGKVINNIVKTKEITDSEIDYVFKKLTNNSYFGEIMNLYINYSKNNQFENKFINKMDDFKVKTQTSKFIFKSSISIKINNYLELYGQNLFDIFGYIEDINEINNQKINKEQYRLLIARDLLLLDKSYDEINDQKFRKKLDKDINLLHKSLFDIK